MRMYKTSAGRKTVKGTTKLAGIIKAKMIAFYTPMICWYMQHGLTLKAVHQLVEYKQGKAFSWFSEEIANTKHEPEKGP